MTGEVGRRGCRTALQNEVYLASTGVIGEPLDASEFAGVLDGAGGGARPISGSRPPRRS